jgi:hypothetical protein
MAEELVDLKGQGPLSDFCCTRSSLTTPRPARLPASQSTKERKIMANICKNTITVVGLKESPDTFLKAFLKAVFSLDLDDLDPSWWGATEDASGWYSKLVEEYREEGCYAAKYCILYPEAPFSKLGVVAPRFYVETKWKPPVNELITASEQFPELTFHMHWLVMQDGPIGQVVVCNGGIVEQCLRLGSWYLFDDLRYPYATLLDAHLPFTLAQHAALRLDNAIYDVRSLKEVLEDERFIRSRSRPFSASRNQEKTDKVLAGLTALLDSMRLQIDNLDFSGVLLEESDLHADESGDRAGEEVLYEKREA